MLLDAAEHASSPAFRMRVFSQLLEQSDFDTAKAAVDAFNAANRWRKRGIAIIPVKCVRFARAPLATSWFLCVQGVQAPPLLHTHIHHRLALCVVGPVGCQSLVCHHVVPADCN